MERRATRARARATTSSLARARDARGAHFDAGTRDAMVRTSRAASTAASSANGDVSHVTRGTAVTRDATAPRRETATEASDTRRFRRAFAGGFVSGRVDAVGTAEGFEPGRFRSTRDARATTTRGDGSATDYMDEDEREEYESVTLRARARYDTFGEGAREAHRAMAWDRGGAGASASETLARSAAVTDLFVAPREDAVGARLLRCMGWRRGRVGGGTGGGVAVDEDETPAYVADPKNDRRGVGYDAFAGAEEFRDAATRRKREMERENAGLTRGRARGEAFGVGVFEEEDEALYTEDEPKLNEYAFEMEEEEEEDESTRDPRARGKGAVLALGAALPNDCLVRGFRVSSDTLAPPKWFAPPVVPRDFRPRAAATLKASMKASAMAASQPELPPKAPPPTNEERKKVIDTLAAFVARHGKTFEDMAKARQGEDDEKFSFLFGGRDSGYYKWRLATAMIEQNSEAVAPPARRARPLGMEERARILGETPLPARAGGGATDAPAPAPAPRQKLSIDGIAADDRERIQKLLSKTFTSGGVVQTAKVEKVGLHVLEKSAPKPAPNEEEAAARADMVSRMPIVSARNTIDWAPEPLVCKRFGIQDPFANRARPDTQEYKFRTDVLALDATSAAALANAPKYLDVPPPPSAVQSTTRAIPPPPPPSSTSAPLPPPPPPPRAATTMVEVPPPPPFVEKPMGLFKAIFENSDDDVEAEEEANETEADLDAIKAALSTRSDPAPVEEKARQTEGPVWSSAVMTNPAAASERDSEKRKRSKKKKEKKEKKEKKRSKDSRRRRKKHRKRSRRNYDSSSSSSSSSYTSD